MQSLFSCSLSQFRILLALILVGLMQTVAFAQDAEESRGMSAEEYKMALDFKVDDLDNDTYVKVADGKYVLDRYDMKPPYFITGDSGVKKRLDLYKITERESMQDLGIVVFFTNTESKETFNLVIPNLKSKGDVWNMYFDDIHQHDREENDVALKMSYVLSKEFAYLMQKASGADVSAMEDSNSDYDFCFPATAMVTLADGSQKAIAEVEAGDAVLSVQNGLEVVTTVEEVSTHNKASIALARVMLTSVETVTAANTEAIQTEVRELVATPNHPVMTENGKKSVEQLVAGDIMYHYNAMTQTVEKYTVEFVDRQYDTTNKVYNLATANDSYIVGGLVVLEK